MGWRRTSSRDQLRGNRKAITPRTNQPLQTGLELLLAGCYKEWALDSTVRRQALISGVRGEALPYRAAGA